MLKRREFLNFLGIGVAVGIANPKLTYSKYEKIKGIDPSSADDLILADGLKWTKLLSWGDKITDELEFGFNNDFTCYIPTAKDEGIFWANHETTDPLFVTGYNYRDKSQKRTQEQIDKEMTTVGGSLVKIKKKNGVWEQEFGHKYNRRLDAHTKIPFNWDEKIEGSDFAIGTHSNCSGGITPWGTFLTCEENYDQFYGENEIEDGHKVHINSTYGWEKYHDYPSEHYGWVVEVDPYTGEAQKHISIGRYAHECCTLQELPDGRIVAYSGDDHNDEFLYKFISSKKRSLKEGTLYVANTEKGEWISMDYDTQEILQKNFENQTDVLIHCRKAGKLLGASPLDRPEDIEIDPLTGHVIITLTNNKPKKNYHGQILKLIEDGGKHDSLKFKTDVLAAGGEETGFSCPDNLAFDKAGNLWFTVDVSSSQLNKPGPWEKFKNNGLFVLIRKGDQAGEIHQIASAPIDAELTGPWFSPENDTLFLSVQHPGSESKDLDNLTSTWPHDKDGIPKSTVVTIQGELLDRITSLTL